MIAEGKWQNKNTSGNSRLVNLWANISWRLVLRLSLATERQSSFPNWVSETRKLGEEGELRIRVAQCVCVCVCVHKSSDVPQSEMLCKRDNGGIVHLPAADGSQRGLLTQTKFGSSGRMSSIQTLPRRYATPPPSPLQGRSAIFQRGLVYYLKPGALFFVSQTSQTH